jgi:plasmid stabilization system protein ParE
MIYTVLWKQQAEDKLAEVWMASADRNAVSEAAAEVGRLLRSGPESQGESRYGSRRIVFIGPLAVGFRIDEEDRTVWILSIHGS